MNTHVFTVLIPGSSTRDPAAQRVRKDPPYVELTNGNVRTAC